MQVDPYYSGRNETRKQGIRVTTVLPGATRTPAWDGVDVPEERLIPAAVVARAMLDCFRLDQRSVVEELLIRPQAGDV